MAPKRKTKEKHYDEGFVRGRRALLIGIFPIFIFLGTVAIGSWVMIDYYNKVTVNEDNSDVCKLVRNRYPSSVRADYPCDLTDKGDYWLVSFSQNTGTSSIPAYISFKVNKSDNVISSAYNTEQ